MALSGKAGPIWLRTSNAIPKLAAARGFWHRGEFQSMRVNFAVEGGSIDGFFCRPSLLSPLPF